MGLLWDDADVEVDLLKGANELSLLAGKVPDRPHHASQVGEQV